MVFTKYDLPEIQPPHLDPTHLYPLDAKVEPETESTAAPGLTKMAEPLTAELPGQRGVRLALFGPASSKPKNRRSSRPTR
jgi:hypothetical protein